MGYKTKIQAGEFLELHSCDQCESPILTYMGPFHKGGIYPFEPVWTCDCERDQPEGQFWMALNRLILGPTIYA
jgi:hypothetical protein